MQNKTPSVTPQHVKAFYILGVQRWKKTTYNYVDWNMHGHAKKKKGWLHTSSRSGCLFLIDLYQGGIFQNNHQLLILNGHGSHVTIEALEQATKIGFNMVTIW